MNILDYLENITLHNIYKLYSYVFLQVKYMGTTIYIDERVRDKLKDMGKKGETYNEIIERLIGEKDGRD